MIEGEVLAVYFRNSLASLSYFTDIRFSHVTGSSEGSEQTG